MNRIRELCKFVPVVHKIADVGCDHGYCARHMLQNGCDIVYVSDISEGSLSKAKKLLAREIQEGRCIPVLADGMKGLPNDLDCVLIAGLGGEEIVRILEEGYLPPQFVFQPMKNSERVRKFLIQSGACIMQDITFGEGKYYDVIAGRREGGTSYSDWEIKFGRDNLKTLPTAFYHKLQEEIAKCKGYLQRNMKRESRQEILDRIYEMEVITRAAEEDI